MQLKRKIVKFVKFVTAFDPGHKYTEADNIAAGFFVQECFGTLPDHLRVLISGLSFQ